MKITIKDVAREANVSIATVSRVLNGKDRVKKSTREKITRAIKTLDFQPDHNARSMIMKKTKTIGMIVPELANEYWSILINEIQKELWETGYTLIIGTSDNRKDKENAVVKSFVEKRVDGIIYGSTNLNCQDENSQDSLIDLAKKYDIPAVTLDPTLSGVDCVIGDHIQGATDATNHLIRLGHRDIVYIGGPFVSQKRELGYRNAFMMNGLIVNENLVKRGEGLLTFQYGYDSVMELLDSRDTFTAIFCGNDVLAFGAIKALEMRGISVPKDVAVVGYDDVKTAQLFKPALTTVKQPIREISRALIALLMESMDNPVDAVPKKIVYQMKLIVRESCGSDIS